MKEYDKSPELPGIPGFAKRLREAVDGAGGATAVSKASGVPLSTLNDYLKGSEARLSKVNRVAQACKVSLDWLITGHKLSASAPEIGLLHPDILNSKAHFWALFVLLRSCQEFHEQMKLTPTLSEVLAWISTPYIQSRELPDNRIEFKPS